MIMDKKKLYKAYSILEEYGVLPRISVIFGVYRPLDKAQFAAQIIANEEWIKKIVVFIDMDNTLFRFSYGKSDDIDAIERMLDVGFFRNLEPMQNIKIYEALQLIGVSVYILSACPPSAPHCRQDKKDALKEHMPFIKNSQILFCNNGESKAEFARKKVHLESLEGVFLIDDWKGNLNAWQAAGGFPIKKAMSFKMRPYPTLIDHRDAVDMILSLAKNAKNN
jgi:5'(3')-deoxyribonucleotidase